VHGRRNKLATLRSATLAGVMSVAAMAATPCLAEAQGLFDFLFGGFQQRQTPRDVSSYAEPPAPIGQVAPPPLGSESVRQGSRAINHAVAYCVRLCDGQNFSMERSANATPVETCRAMCPASKTRVFFGSAVDHAVAADGTRYADLDAAFVYRQHFVANCTCNGKDASGLAPFDVSKDATLRPGDIVSTQQGFVAYSGKHGQSAAFTPVAAATVAAELNPAAPPQRRRLARRAEPSIEDDPGTIVPSPGRQAEMVLPSVDLSAQAVR
jgi:hypothetical protein